MKLTCLPVLAAGFLAACAGDNHTTTQSAREPARYAAPTSAGAEINNPKQVPGKYASGRVYIITRLETTDQPRGEWRTQGDSIREKGSEIEFVELGSGKLISFTAPHQITPTDAHTDRSTSTTTAPGPTAKLYP